MPLSVPQFLPAPHGQAFSSAINTPVEISSPYTEDELAALRWTQSADVLYIFHPDHPVYKLERISDTNWSLVQVQFEDGPWGEINPGTDLSSTNLLINGAFDSGFSHWTPVVSGTGYATYNSTSRSVLLTNSATGAGTATIYQGVTTLSPTAIHVLHFQIVGGGTVTLQVGTAIGASDIATNSYTAGWYSVQFTPGVSPFYVEFTASPGSAPIAPGVSGAFCYTTSANLLKPSATTGTVTITAQGGFAPFVATDAGRQIRFEYPGREPGWATITTFTSSQQVQAAVSRNLQDTAPLETWRLGAWSNTTGYPALGAFYQQRLFTARTDFQPQTLWASQSSDFENMRPDSWTAGARVVEDVDALNFTLATNKVSPIVWIIGARKLVVGAKSGQWSISSKGVALTPSDFSADPQTSVAGADMPPVQIDTYGLFAQKALRGLYDIGFNFEIDSFQASDLTVLSDHITKGNIAQIVYQAEPFSNVWVRLETGTLACLTYKRGQNVVGWTPVEIAGSAAGDAVVEALATIPGDDDVGQTYSSINRNELWVIVKRTINGSAKRFIEMLEGVFDGLNRAHYTDKDLWRADIRAQQVDAFYVDSGLSYVGAPVAAVSGLGHLEGEEVVVLADGADQSARTVTGGSITLDGPASTIHVGLAYTYRYRGMKLPYGSPTGPGVGQTKTIPQMVLVLRDAGPCTYSIDLAGEGEDNAGDLVFQPIPVHTDDESKTLITPLFSGEVTVDTGGSYSSDPRIVIEGDGALPFTLLGVRPTVSEHEL